MGNKENGYRIKRGGFHIHKKNWLLSLLGAAGVCILALVIAWTLQHRQEAARSVETLGSSLTAGASGKAASSLSSSGESSAASSSSAPASSAPAAPAPIVVSASKGAEESGQESASSSSQESTGAIVVPAGGEAQKPSSSGEAPQRPDFSLPYQVAASGAVDDSYFDDAMFVGDSITSGISLYSVMSGATVVASTGINPTTILTKPAIRDQEGELHTILETMSAYAPAKIYIMLGANGVGWLSQEQFLSYYGGFVDAVAAQHPKAQIFIQSILPVTMEKSLSENGIYANEKVDRYNRALMEYSKKKGLPFVNVAEALKGADGALPADASSDGMHFGPSYYEKWFDYLRSHTLEREKEGERKK